MSNYTIRDGQTLFDIAVEVYGDVEAVYWLLDDNRSLLASLTSPLRTGVVLVIRDEVKNPRMVTYLADFAPFYTAYNSNYQ